MRLFLIALFLGLTASLTLAAEPPAGNWKFRFGEDQRTITFLLAFSQAEGKWVGDFISSSPPLKDEPKFNSISLEGDLLKFGLTFSGKEFVNFEGRVAKDGNKITGTFSKFGGPLLFVDLFPSKLKKLNDPIELAREDITQSEVGPDLFNLAFSIFAQAAEKKVAAEEIRSIADRVSKAAATYGPRWEKAMAIRMATVLGEQTGYSDIALAQARRAERMLPENPKPAESREVFQALVTVLEKSGKAEEAKKYVSFLQKLDEFEYAEFLKAASAFSTTEYKGRKSGSTRVVVVEQLTSCEVPLCAAIETSLLGLSRTFKPADVLFLSYHVPAGGMDAMSCQDGLERLSLYAEENKIGLEVPKILINGIPGPSVATRDEKKQASTAEASKLWYEQYRVSLEKELEKTSTVKLTLAATKAEKGFSFKATVTDLEKPGEKIALRFVLLEQRIRYSGRNALAFHENVVRALPGGVKGFPLTKKTAEQEVSFDIPKLQASQREFLDEFTKRVQETALASKPADFKNLKLVALVQDNTTGEILQATQIDVK